MAENHDQHRGWSQIFNPVTTMLGLTDSTSDKRLPAGHPEPGDEAPDNIHRSLNTLSEGNRERPFERRDANDTVRTGYPRSESVQARYRDNAPSDDRSQSGEHVSEIYSLQGSAEARPRPGTPGSERMEMKDIILSYEASQRVKDNEIAVLKCHIQEIEETHTQREERHRSVRAQRDEARSHNSHQAKSLEEAQRQCQRRDRELEKLRELLNQRTEEVKVAQAFMTTADKYSTSEISLMVEELNDEIYQCSMDLSDAMLGQGIAPKDSALDEDARKRFERAQKFFAKSWNPEVINRLAADLSRHHDPDSTLFDCVAQYALVDWVHGIIRSFCQQNKDVDRYLTDLWENVTALHETSISRNWLAITRATLKSQGQPLDRAVIMERLANLMAVSGREALPANRLEEVIGGKLNQVATKTLRVKEAIAEGVLSVDVEVFSCTMNVEFHPSSMRDAWGNPGRYRKSGDPAEGDLVVCPTGLGLCRIIQEPRTSDPSRVRKKQETLLKTKVLLYSTLNE
ncbi:hypothetical protein FA13DRAFT_1725552 [Coprinellus micaceus]|uniref:Uncharacterized protein n=1 Tax=Coprinellus micaceus TaxID=71717 RepID=A0A4Y7TVL5_COPMI|nr:hypothetical protein FA13DRAFT_1725552 [Coprinellus micaceus]